MDANTLITLAAARYSDRDGAVKDFHNVWDARHDDEFDHTAVAVLSPRVRTANFRWSVTTAPQSTSLGLAERWP